MENLRSGRVNWVRGSCIGRGCFGTVHTAVSKPGRRVFAVKSVDLSSCLPAQAEALENEIHILKSISSKYVVEYLHDDSRMENGASFRNLHMEYMPGGTAADVVKDEKILRSRVYCIVAGLRDVHNMGIVHCDVKGRNVLVGSSPCAAKLADFGSASFAAQSTAGRLVPRGSPLWMAPEVVRGEYQGPESDVWSLGCTVIEMVTGQPPWGDSGSDTLLRIGYSDEIPELPAQLSELGKDFLEKCLRRDFTKRWSCDQLLRHPFVSLSEPLNPITHVSPRCVLDWTTSEFSDNEEENDQFTLDSESDSDSMRGRIAGLASSSGATWESDGWVDVRNIMSDKTEAGTSCEYSYSSRAEMEIPSSDSATTEVSNSGDGMAVAEHGSNQLVMPTYLSWMHGHVGFTAGKIILIVDLLIFTAIICTSILFTIIILFKKLHLLFRFYLRFQSSHVTKLLTLSAVLEIFFVKILLFRILAILRIIKFVSNYHKLWGSISNDYQWWYTMNMFHIFVPRFIRSTN